MSLADSVSVFIAKLTGDYVYTPSGVAVGAVAARIPGGGVHGGYAVNLVFNTGYDPSVPDYLVVKSDVPGKYMKVGLAVSGGFSDDPQVSGTATKIADLVSFTPAPIGGSKPATVTNPVRGAPGTGTSDALSTGLNMLNTRINIPLLPQSNIPLWLILVVAGAGVLVLKSGGRDD